MQKILSATLIAGATLALATALPIRAGAANYPPPIQAGKDGVSPVGTLTLGADGLFYGTCFEGGADGLGSIFCYDPHGNGDPVVLHSFSKANNDGNDPTSQLVEDAAGNIFGVTGTGGVNGNGTIFMLTAAGQYVRLYSFPSGSTPGAGQLPQGLTEYANDLFVGATDTDTDNSAGAVFTFSVNPGIDGSAPALAAPPKFYSLGPAEGAGSNGSEPSASLTLGPGNLLYGTASTGGLYNYGTVYSFNPATGAIADVHNFSGYDDGATPYSPLLYANGLLYGTTYQGGLPIGGSSPYQGDGTIYSIDASGAHQTLHRFNGTDGIDPLCPLIVGENGDIWLTVPEGGKDGVGLVMDFGGGTDIRCASFRGIDSADHDGSFPEGGLTLGDDGLYYGVTTQGGEHGGNIGDGILFSFNPATMTHTIIHYFGKALHTTGS